MTVRTNLCTPSPEMEAAWDDNVFDNLFYRRQFPGIGEVIVQLFPSEEAIMDPSKDTTSIWSVVDEAGGAYLVAAETRAIAIQGLRLVTTLGARSAEPSGLPMPRQVLAKLGIPCDES